MGAHIVEPVDPPDRYVYAATDHRPRTAEERELCESADHPDWLYMGALGLLTVGSVVLDKMVASEPAVPGAKALQPERDAYTDAMRRYSSDGSAALRLTTAGTVGLTWGALVTGTYLSLPKCNRNWVPSASPEGTVRSHLPLGITLSALAAATAPLFVAIETGPFSAAWGVPERGLRVVIPMATGLIGSLLPYIHFLAPKTWRASLKLNELRLQGSPIPPGDGGLPKDRGAWFGISGRF